MKASTGESYDSPVTRLTSLSNSSDENRKERKEVVICTHLGIDLYNTKLYPLCNGYRLYRMVLARWCKSVYPLGMRVEEGCAVSNCASLRVHKDRLVPSYYIVPVDQYKPRLVSYSTRQTSDLRVGRLVSSYIL